MIGLGKTKLSEKGMTLLEALVSTAIIGIGFVAVFQMVNYSVQSIDVSGERTKANYLVSMVAEDLISERDSNSPTTDVKFKDYLINNSWSMANCSNRGSSSSNFNNAVQNKFQKWDKRFSKETGLPVHIAEDPLACVAIGTGKALDQEETFSSMLTEY